MLLILLSGCGQSGPDVAPVKGRITLDSQPLANVGVQFQPEGGMRPSSGGTDDNGEYELFYKRGVMGARIGPNKVRIITDPNDPKAPTVPDRYKTQSELKVDVKPGNNEFNFELK